MAGEDGCHDLDQARVSAVAETIDLAAVPARRKGESNPEWSRNSTKRPNREPIDRARLGKRHECPAHAGSRCKIQLPPLFPLPRKHDKVPDRDVIHVEIIPRRCYSAVTGRLRCVA